MQTASSDRMFVLLFSVELIFSTRVCVGETHPLRYAVDEESRQNTYIGNILADSKMSASLIPTILLADNRADNKADKLLKLEHESGNLLTAVVIDREKVCQVLDKQCFIEAAVQFTTGTLINIFVEIKDVNDHAPTFPRSAYEYVLSEKVEMGYRLRLEQAHDSDFGMNSNISYKLQRESSTYSLSRSKEEGLFLLVNTNLDYEMENLRRITLHLVACDSGSPKLCGSTDVSVILTDVNDNEPRFEKAEFEALIQETVAVNSIVFTFSATDLDSGENGRIKYSIIPSGNSVTDSFFIINENGHLRLIKSLENVNVEEITLRVIAEDFGSPSLRSSCTLRMKIVDVNNHRPEIKVTMIKGRGVMENEPPMTLVAVISVVDHDKGSNGITKCDYTGSKEALLMKYENRIKNNNFYNLLTRRIIDREVDALFEMSVTCKDEGDPPLSTVKNFTVEVGDVNEHPPTFQNENQEVRIPEDTEISTTIFRLLTNDKDSIANLTYKLVYESNYFYVNPRSGTIIVKSRLDREEIDIFSLTCQVIDNTGGRVFVTKTTLTVKLLDVNDNVPKLQPPKAFHIRENIPRHSKPIGKLTASDEDNEENGTVTFNLLRVDVAVGVSIKYNTVEKIFKIDNRTGDIYLMSTLDREEASKYKISVRLSDGGREPLYTDDYLEIEVIDENDNRPKFDLPFSEYNISLPFDLDIPIMRVKATDADTGVNANVTYSLLSGSQFFKLNAITGQLHAAKVLEDGAFELTFQASDNGSPPLYSEVAHIRVRVWPSSSYGLSNEEKERIDSLLIIIIASSTCVVFLCLLSAIIIVKWQRDPRNPSRGPKNDDDDQDSSTLQKWTDQQNQYTLSIGNRYYRPTSTMSQEMGMEECDKNIDENNVCSMFHFRYPIAQELEMSSADSGKGTIEEDNVLFDLKGKCLSSNRSCVTMVNPYQNPLTSRYSSTLFMGNSSPKFSRLENPGNLTESNFCQAISSGQGVPLDALHNIPLTSFLSL